MLVRPRKATGLCLAVTQGLRAASDAAACGTTLRQVECGRPYLHPLFTQGGQIGRTAFSA